MTWSTRSATRAPESACGFCSPANLPRCASTRESRATRKVPGLHEVPANYHPGRYAMKLLALVAALALPSLALADDSKTTKTPSTDKSGSTTGSMDKTKGTNTTAKLADDDVKVV